MFDTDTRNFAAIDPPEYPVYATPAASIGPRMFRTTIVAVPGIVATFSMFDTSQTARVRTAVAIAELGRMSRPSMVTVELSAVVE
jgi:hypothetical protein